jgi:hypothetical protein
LERLKERCPHKRLELNRETGETICKDCFSVVGYPVPPEKDDPGFMRDDTESTIEDDELPFHPTSDEEIERV